MSPSCSQELARGPRLALVLGVVSLCLGAAPGLHAGAQDQSRAVVLVSEPNPYTASGVPEQGSLMAPLVRLLRDIYLSLPQETQARVEGTPSGFAAEVKWEDLTQEQRQEWVNIAVAYNWGERPGRMWRWDFDGISDGAVRFWFASRKGAEDGPRAEIQLGAAYEIHVWNSRWGRPAGELRSVSLGLPLLEPTLVTLAAENPYHGCTLQELSQAALQFYRDVYWSIPEEKRRDCEARAPNVVLTVGWEALTQEQRERWVNLFAAQHELRRGDPVRWPSAQRDFPGANGGYFKFGWYVIPGTQALAMWYEGWLEQPDPVTGLPDGGSGWTPSPFEPGPYS